MSTTYLLYLEANIDGKWKCIDGFYKYLPYGKQDEVLGLSHLYVNGSRSYFESTYEKLQEIGTMTSFAELSAELQDDKPEMRFKYDHRTGSPTDEVEYYLTVPVKALKEITPKGYEHHGVYHKDKLSAYDAGEIEDLYDWDDEAVDFSKMDVLERQCYEYREWDSPTNWPWHFKELCRLVSFIHGQYVTDTWDFTEHDMRIVVFVL